MDTRELLLRDINRFLKETGMAPSTFGANAIGDRTLMLSLRDGRDPRMKTADKIRAYMARERAKLEDAKRKKEKKKTLPPSQVVTRAA